MKISFYPPPLYKCIVVFSLALLLSFTLFSCGGVADGVPDGYGNVRVSFGSSRNVTQGDKDNATLRVYFNGNQVEKNGNVFEDRVPTGTRLTITAEAVNGGRLVGKGEETITVRGGNNNVSMQVYTYDNFVVTIDGKATGYTNFDDAWDSASGKTATIKMNADATNVSVTLNNGNVTLDLNGHTLNGTGSNVVINISGGTFNLTGTGTVKQPANASTCVITDSSIFNMYSGTITGGNAAGYGYGGGVNVQGTFNMYGGYITGNEGSGSDGSGVGVVGGTFTMYGGYITNNVDADFGAGVYSEATFIMKGGTISGNSSTNLGGGVFINDGGFNWEGGTISGNTAQTPDGGNNVRLDAPDNTTYNLNGRDSLFRSVTDPQGSPSLVMD